MEQRSTLLLRLAVIGIGIPVLALCIFLLPQIVQTAIVDKELIGTKIAYTLIGTVTIMYIAAIPFYYTLFQAWKLLSSIDNNQAFTQNSVIALKKIKTCAILISCFYTPSVPLIGIIARWMAAPGLVLIGAIIVGISIIIAIFASLLQRLLKEAIDIKSENDLII